jgi:hypothetical protein
MTEFSAREPSVDLLDGGADRVAKAGEIHAAPMPSAAREGERNGGIDALRAAVTLLVVFHHTALTYGAPSEAGTIGRSHLPNRQAACC